MSNTETSESSRLETTADVRRAGCKHELEVDGLRAFLTEACGIRGIVLAKTASKARYATFRSAWDAGFSIRLIDITVKRVPDHDNGLTRYGEPMRPGQCYGEDML